MDVMAEREAWLAQVVWSLAGLMVVVVLGCGLVLSERPPEGPVRVAWERERCAHCQSHVSEPAFAAQLQTRDGGVLHFDDPGCLLRYEAERSPSARAVYFHHVREDRWLSRERTGFVPVGFSPRGYGWGAVAAGMSGSRSPEDVLSELRRQVASSSR